MAVYFRPFANAGSLDPQRPSAGWITSYDNMSWQCLSHSSLLASQDRCGCGDRSKTNCLPNLFTRTTDVGRAPRDLSALYSSDAIHKCGGGRQWHLAACVRTLKDDPQGDSVVSQHQFLENVRCVFGKISDKHLLSSGVVVCLCDHCVIHYAGDHYGGP